MRDANAGGRPGLARMLDASSSAATNFPRAREALDALPAKLGGALDERAKHRELASDITEGAEPRAERLDA
ncbi:MAG: hypothetical protein IPG50_27940 [Myxococcales bacterium]|nr:hypothetical protein [Myxococcales bacterium]